MRKCNESTDILILFYKMSQIIIHSRNFRIWFLCPRLNSFMNYGSRECCSEDLSIYSYIKIWNQMCEYLCLSPNLTLSIYIWIFWWFNFTEQCYNSTQTWKRMQGKPANRIQGSLSASVKTSVHICYPDITSWHIEQVCRAEEITGSFSYIIA